MIKDGIVRVKYKFLLHELTGGKSQIIKLIKRIVQHNKDRFKNASMAHCKCEFEVHLSSSSQHLHLDFQ